MSLLSVSSSFRKPKQAAEQTTRLSGDLQENRSFVFFSILISRNLMFYVAAVRERRPSNSEFQPLQRGTSSTAAKQHVYVFDFSLRHVTPTQCRPPPPIHALITPAPTSRIKEALHSGAYPVRQAETSLVRYHRDSSETSSN